MIRFRRLQLHLLNAWLVELDIPHTHPSYRLRVWRDDAARFDTIRNELVAYFSEALDDARRRIRRGFADPLSPFTISEPDPAANFPALLHRVTLQGYLGETLAVLAVEHWGAHGFDDWQVPAFLFRIHDAEFQHLERINELLQEGTSYDPDSPAEQRPGRTGDDALAFRVNDSHVITDVLTLEAKCLTEHKTAKIQEAHEKLAAGMLKPSGVRELINLLDEYDSAEARRWQHSLLLLWHEGYQRAARHDGICYACGNSPSQNGRRAWMSESAPHVAYTAARGLACMEFQFSDLMSVVDAVYRGDRNGQ